MADAIGNYDFKNVEPKILKFWEDKKVYRKAKDKNKGKAQYYFLDGPPYTSGKVHIGTAWNKSIKDMILRYKRMAGFDVWDRAGYDMHGLPTERAVQKELKISGKEEILKLGVAKFVEECKKFSLKNLEIMNKDFIKMGVWMDFENAYQTISKEVVEGVWWLVKQAHKQDRLYEGLRTMTWCADCATALAKHELEYETVKETSVFVKFKVKGKKNEYLIIWTTTPWTIPLNLAVMVNPELDYVRCAVDGETWIVAKALAGGFIQGVADKPLKILEEFTGEKLEGVEYEHPFSEEMGYAGLKKKHPKLHTVLLSKEYVDTTAGTGLVHCAPGCGPEDYEVGYANNLPPYNPLNEVGAFPEGLGQFSGLIAKRDDKKFVDALKKKGVLIAVADVEHEYAHCQRCHNPVIFRATKQWFFKVEDLKEKMIKENDKIKWIPVAAYNAFDSWLKNLRDNSITKQRFWGTPIPIWKCESCGRYDVVESLAELKKLSGKMPKDWHKPWIDEITIPCECGKVKKRIPDIIDVWVDAGTTSWTCLDYPSKKDNFEKLFPADFIMEGKDQIRGWFNLLHIASILAFGKPSFKACYMHGFTQDSQGRKMSKSLGNYILPEEVISKYGADTMRYYMIGGAKPAVDLNYNFDDMKLKNKNLAVLWNLHKFLIDYANTIGKNPAKLKFDAKHSGNEEMYMLSRLNSTIEKVTGLFEEYLLNEVPAELENLYLDLSRKYIRSVRDKSARGSEDEKKAVLYTIYTTMIELLKMFTTVVPFISEEMYQNLKREFGLKEESINLYAWPKPDAKMIDKDLELQVDVSNNIVQAALFAREKSQLGIRWPAKELIIVTKDDAAKKAIEVLEDTIKTQANVKELRIMKEMKDIKVKVRADFKKLGPKFGKETPIVIAKLSQEPASKILKSLEEKSKFELKVENKKYEIARDDLLIEREVPSYLAEAEFRLGMIYLNKERNEDLEAEGFAREITRRVQSLRKDAGLNKTERIALVIKVDSDFAAMLKPWVESIQEKVGASQIKISEEGPAKKHKNTGEAKIKGKDIKIYFDKV